MKYKELFNEENLQAEERYQLSLTRIKEIKTEKTVDEKYQDFFQVAAAFILEMDILAKELSSGCYQQKSLTQLKKVNDSLYQELRESNYDQSYGNPDYAVKMAGAVYGPLFSFLYAEIRGFIVYAFEGRNYLRTIFQELFIEFYNAFEAEGEPEYEKLRDIIYWFMSDYSDVLVSSRIEEQIDPQYAFAAEIIMESDLSDLRYLYYFGEFISENELTMARYLNSLDEEKIQALADTYTEGYRKGFILANKDLSKKETVNIRYQLGFERIVRQAILNFEQMGLKPVIYRAAVSSINKRQQHRIGYQGGIPGKQFDYDHRSDQAIYFDKPFVERKLSVVRSTYEKNKELAGKFAGPAVIETFGETPFVPASKETALELDEKQQKLSVYYDSTAAQLTNEYIRGDERSFTIIAFPVPEIGSQFEAIFDEVVKINTLDYELYQEIQQCLIQALDQGEYVRITGKGDNQTDLKVNLYPLSDPEKETRFENCVADVNIPVGEVFTSPVLQGTCGILHVGQVYLNGLEFKDLKITFQDGRIQSYTCSNFEDEEENKKYIFENVLYHHDSLPMGEFAIGTNTTAYVMAKRYNIGKVLPILIAEKTGPHFAVGDTCYSWSEDNPVFNPDGREIVARDNEQSILRKEDVSKAYLNCHTDITIPYEELGEIVVVMEDQTELALIRNGKFVLSGTEKLNEPLEHVE